ncbi:MAG: thiamine pyrophosphate-binding protein [Beijerinckiaceae bacterium]
MNVAVSKVNTQEEEVVGDLVARALAEAGVTHAFGVISIHNMPILDAIHRQGRMTFVPARSESGALNMADAFARVTGGLGVAITSTGTAAGNACGSQVEALTAGSPVLHITSQIDTPYMDRDRAAIHDVPRQFDMLKAVSKSVFRIWEARGAIPTLQAAMSAALSAPSGPVSVEIPVDVQRMTASVPGFIPAPAIAVVEPAADALDALAELARGARRPMLWLGGGARGASREASALVQRGFCAVTSTQGRATVPETHPRSLGAFNMTPQAQEVFDDCDLMIVVGSRLRGNETRNNLLRLGKPLVQIDAEASQGGRNYAVDLFVHADARLALGGLLERLPEKLDLDAAFAERVAKARASGEEALRATLGPYCAIADALRERVLARALPFVRDVTISNSTFGNRYVLLADPRLGVHALGGGIGQGAAMALGAATAAPHKRTVALIGDGGAQLNLGEFATAVDQQAPVAFILMNDQAYGVISNIQDAQYEGRRVYCRLTTPDFELFAKSIGLPHERVSRAEDFAAALDRGLSARGPCMIEVDMNAIGPFAVAFGGPPAGAAGGAR